jgi:cell division protein FtsW
VFSASSTTSLLGESGDSAHYFKRTVIFAALGLVALRLLSRRGARVARVLTPVLLAVSLFFLLVVLFPGIGHVAGGARRWIGAGLFQFQPSELVKVALILYGAHLLATRPKRARSLRGLAPYLAAVGLALVLVAAQPDLGSAVVIALSAGCLMIVAGVKPRTLAPVAGVIAVAGLLMIATHPYQEARLTSFLDPAGDTAGAGFQGTQATIALGSGGVAGVGLGESVQKAFYLPEAHTDMIAAVIGEEMGLAGVTVLISLFGMFGYAGFRTAQRARDRYTKLLAAGLTSLIMAQAVVNLFAVLGLGPLTGVPLPFVSYGGTSLVVTLASAGLLLNIAAGRAALAQSADGRRRSATRKPRGARGHSSADAKLRLVEGANQTQRRRRARRGTSRDSGGWNRRTRRAGNRRRRRAAG